MREFNVPIFGYSKLSRGDFAFILMGSGLIIWGISDVLSGADNAVVIVLACLQAITGVTLFLITLHHGRQRVKWEESPNAVKLHEALVNHALIEGL